MKVKWFVPVAVAVLVVVAVLLRPKRTQQAFSSANEPALEESTPKAKSKAKRATALLGMKSSGPGLSIPPHPALDLLDEPVPPAAQPFLVRSIQTAQLINQYRRRFPPGGHGDGLMESLAENLFKSDYTYAALATGELDPSDAADVYKALSAKIIPVQPEQFNAAIEIEPVEISPIDLPELTLDELREHHEAFLRNPDTETYKKVWEVVEPHDPQAETDLFKDALLYAVLDTQMNNWIKTEDSDYLERVEGMIEFKDTNPEGFERVVQDHRNIADHQITQYLHVQMAYEDIFGRRFQARGIEDPDFLQKLKGLSIEGVGGRDFDFP